MATQALEVKTAILGRQPSGVSILSNLADTAALIAVETAILSTGSTAQLADGSMYRFDAAASSGGLTPTSGGGRWYLLAPNGEGFNVKTFGALGDGVTNDTVSIQAAIDYVAGIGGGTVQFPKGNYLCVGLVLKAGVILRGLPGATDYPQTVYGVRFTAAATGYIVDTPAGSTIAMGIDGISFYGLGAGTACVGIHIRNATRSCFRDLFFDNFADQAILMLAGVANEFRYIQAQNCLLNRTRSGDDGVFKVAGTDHFFLECELTASVTTNKTAGGNCHAFYIAGGTHFFTNCIGEISDIGFFIAGSGLNRFTACRADLNMMHGFYVSTGGSQFIGCFALNNSQDTTNVYSGFYNLISTAQGSQYIGCNVSSNIAKVHKYGFEDYAVYDATTSRNFYSGCRAVGFGTNAYLISNSIGLGSGVSVANVAVRDAVTGAHTVSVEQASVLILTQAAPGNITNFTGGTPNQDIYIYGNANVTITQGANIKTSTGADKVLAAEKIYHFKFVNSVWYEVTT